MSQADTDSDTQAFLARLSAEEHAALRGFAYATDTSMNDVVRRAVREFLAGPARREQVRSATAKLQQQYAAALDKLAGL